MNFDGQPLRAVPPGVVEAMGAGLPVVAIRGQRGTGCGHRRRDGPAGACESPDLLGRAIGYLLDSPRPRGWDDCPRTASIELTPGTLGSVLSEAYGRRDIGAPPADSAGRCHDAAGARRHRHRRRGSAGEWCGSWARPAISRPSRSRSSRSSARGWRRRTRWPSARAPRPSRWRSTALGLPRGAPVYCPTLTFCGAVQAIIHAAPSWWTRT